ncbi:pilus assembly protein PilZ, partial [Dehalococcoides mccartyi]
MIGMKKLIKGEKGASLAIALIFLAIGAIMIPPLLMLIGSGLQQGTAIEERTAGIYDSDAGVEWAINLIKTGGVGLPNGQDSSRTYILSALNGDTLEVKLTYHNEGSYYEV